MHDQYIEEKRRLLQQWGGRLYAATCDGTLYDGRPIEIGKPVGLAGPRAAVLMVPAGMNTGLVLRRLEANQAALARQFIPFSFGGDPSIYLDGRHIRLEVNWPESYAWRDVRASEINRRPYGSGRFLCGVAETGSTMSLAFSEELGHIGIFGATGSGKTTALQTILIELSRNGRENGDRTILIDGKHGPMLHTLDHLGGMVGPLQTSIEGARRALSYANAEMNARYNRSGPHPRLIVAVDEVTEFMRDGACAALVQRLARLGREASLNLLLGTQRPTLLSDPTVRGNLLGRVVLSLGNANDSYQATDRAEIHADRLGGAGDAYIIKPGASMRTQIARYTEREIEHELTAQPELDEYPEFEAEEMGTAASPGRGQFTPGELSAALISAAQNHGRDRLRSRLGAGGSTKLQRLLDLGRAVYAEIQAENYELIGRAS